VPRLFELPTALLEYLDLLWGVAVPCSPGCYTYMMVIMKYTIQQHSLIIAGEPCIEAIAPRAPLTYLSSEKKTLAPCPQCCYAYIIMIIKMIEIYNIAARPYYRWHTASKQSHHAPHLRIYCIKEGASLPAKFKPLFSSTNQQLFKKNFCNQSSLYRRFP